MCEKIPFHHDADATDGDLPDWAGIFRGLSAQHKQEQTDLIRRTINLQVLMKRISGETTRVNRPSIIPEMAEE